ncbi:MAG: ferritin [Firmicutes bacterium]|jgi:ferritin|nr:ferritin [Bacillota bacterium]
MMNKRMEDAFNKQINAELYSAYLYLSMSACFEDMNLPGFANWMRVQFQEEQFHGLKMFDFVNERGGRVNLLPIEGPETNWETPLDIFEEVYKHEQHVTSLINGLVTIAMEESDYASNNFLAWFVDEQVEEEASASEILGQLKFIGDNKHAVLMMDRELRTRVFNPPVKE